MYFPKISIVTPSYNQGEYIEDTIKSIIEQNYPNLEYIIVDGGSTDNSVEIIKKYEKHLTWWCTEKDKGHGDALNKGFSRCTGEIMAWLNSDDKYFPWTLHTVAEIFNQHKDINWIVGKNAWFDEKGRLVDARNLFINKYDYASCKNQWVQQESVFWNRTLWEESGGYINQDFKFMVDGELWSRFFQYTELWHVNMVLGGFRNHGINRGIQNNDVVLNEMQLNKQALVKQFSIRDQRVAYRLNAFLRWKGRITSFHSKMRIIGTLILYIIKMLYYLTFPRKKRETLAYKTLEWNNCQWIQKNSPYVI
jgi:glycosyltransferase involved in cell wall biosynthesis